MQPGILVIGVDCRLSIRVQQMLFDAVVPVIIGVDNLTVAITAPGSLTLFVVIALAGQVVTVVILKSYSGITGLQHDRTTFFIQIFYPDIAPSVIP